MKIGYSPISADYSHPEDHRKVCFYLKEKGLSFEKASLERDYDLVFLSTLADIEGWRLYKSKSNQQKKKCKIVFNLTDAYLSADQYDVRNVLRGGYRFITGRSSRFRLSYKESLIDMIRVADAITCGSIESKRQLMPFNSNVHIIHDYFGGDIRERKSSLDIEIGSVDILWQGLSHGNLKIFELLRDILSGITNINVNLHVITGQTYCRFGSLHVCQPTSSLLQKVFHKSNTKVFFYSWHSTTFSAIASSCDIALIPIPKEDPIMWRKPENKLIELWSIGLPVLTSPTPAYNRVMQEAGVDWTCEGMDQWRNRINELVGSRQHRENYMNSVKRVVDGQYSKQNLIARWDTLLESLS